MIILRTGGEIMSTHYWVAEMVLLINSFVVINQDQPATCWGGNI